MKKIRSLIVDDEISAALTLRGMLGAFCPQVEVVGHAGTADEAFLAVEKLKPELVFLDIEMPPPGNGFDFLDKYRVRDFAVIFTTAYPQYAIKAINQSQPIGYLVKPFSDLELVHAVHIASDYVARRAATNTPSTDMATDNSEQRIIIADHRKGQVVLKLSDIIYCKADGSTTDIYYIKNGKTERITASKTLKDIETSLPRHLFCRTHHSYVVNLVHIERFEKTGRNGVIYLTGEILVDVSVMRMEAFEQAFNAFING